MNRCVRLIDISKNIGSGITPLRSNESFWNNGSIPWLKTEQLGEYEIYNTSEKISEIAFNETSIKLFPVNTISIAMYGEGKTRGSVSILKREMTTNQACCNIVIDERKAHYKYVYYYLKTQYHQLRSLSSGVRKNLNSNDIKQFEIRLPDSIDEQKRIADFLSKFDDKLNLNNRINSELEGMAKLLYDYWFVQFDFPDENGKPYKSSGGKMIYNQDLKREIPEGWRVEKVSECCKIVDCLHSKKSDFNFENENTFLLQLENIQDDGLIDLSKKYYVSSKDYKTWTSRIEVQDNDIVITNAGRVAATAQIPNDFVAGIGRNITAIRPTTISPTFLFVAFRGPEMKRQIALNTDTGSFFKSLNVKGIKELFVVRPSKVLEKKFEEIALSQRRKRESNKLENQKLSSLRDWLIPMLMNGQVSAAGNKTKQSAYQTEDSLLMAAEPKASNA